MKTNIFYVYGYLRTDGTPYYIGKGRSKRIDDAHQNVKVPPKDRRVKLRENLEEQEAYDYEMELIKKYGRKRIDEDGILYNVAVGGPYAATKLLTEEERIESQRRARLKYYNAHKDDPEYMENRRLSDKKRNKSEKRQQWNQRSEVKEYKNKNALKFYYETLKQDPERYAEHIEKNRIRRRKQRSTAEGREEHNNNWRKYYQKMREDPERWDAYLEKKRDYRRKND